MVGMVMRTGPAAKARRAVVLLAAGGAVLAAAPAGAQAPEAWVGCWTLEHREDWAPNVNQQGFPTGSAAPAPRTLLLDRLPGQRSNLQGAPGVRTFRAEWIGSTLRGTEAWALRGDGHVYVENVPGVRVISLLLQGPPADGEAPAMWFFRRTDTPFPEIRSLATARKVRCPEGKEPHTQVERAELAEYLAEAGVEGVFVLYDQGARRIVRVNPGADGGLPLGSGTARTTAWNQVARLVDEGGGANADTPLAERGGDAGAGTAWIAGRERTPGGALFGWALHLSRAPAGWVAEGEEAEALEALARRLVEGVLGEGGG
jgi:hypothetical protein